MKAIAIDSSINCISFAAKNGDKYATISLDIGMRQSEKLLSSIAYVLKQVELEPSELEFSVLCQGPGSFTGLRLSYAALKALELTHNCPIFAIPTLEAIAYPYTTWKGAVLPVIDAKKNRFYASLYRNGEMTVEPIDASAEDILNLLDKEESVLVVGSDAELFVEKALTTRPDQNIIMFQPSQKNTTLSLLEIGYKKYQSNDDPIKDYDGPLYIRKSEAEENLNNV